MLDPSVKQIEETFAFSHALISQELPIVSRGPRRPVSQGRKGKARHASSIPPPSPLVQDLLYYKGDELQLRLNAVLHSSRYRGAAPAMDGNGCSAVMSPSSYR